MDRRLAPAAILVFGLFSAAEAAFQAAARAHRRVFPRRPRGQVLQPGEHTPLWNLLVEAAQRHLRVRGSKNQLARLLGLPRQRIFDCLKARSACLDAERTLMLLSWVAGQEQGKHFHANLLAPPPEEHLLPGPRRRRGRRAPK